LAVKVVIVLVLFVLIGVAAVIVVSHRNGNRATAGGSGASAALTTAAAVATTAITPATTIAPGTTTVPAAPVGIPASLSASLYQGAAFSIRYPTGWVVSHVSEGGGNVDTTFRPASGPGGWILRVDEDPESGGSLQAATDPVITALERDPTYSLTSLVHASFAGVPAIRWEFEDAEDGVRLHKVDTFFIDGNGNGWAVLVEAPQSVWGQASPILENYRASFSDLASS
jgi:hypothetical protein